MVWTPLELAGCGCWGPAFPAGAPPLRQESWEWRSGWKCGAGQAPRPLLETLLRWANLPRKWPLGPQPSHWLGLGVEALPLPPLPLASAAPTQSHAASPASGVYPAGRRPQPPPPLRCRAPPLSPSPAYVCGNSGPWKLVLKVLQGGFTWPERHLKAIVPGKPQTPRLCQQ